MMFGYNWSEEYAAALLWQEMLRRQAEVRPPKAMAHGSGRVFWLRRFVVRMLPRLAQGMF